jgi:Mn2+/Fe2+ NRAMP family transporter
VDSKEIAKKYIHHRNLLVRGQLELGVVMSLINTGMLFGLFLKSVLNIPTHYVVFIIVVSVIVLAVSQYLYGWYYEQKKLFDEENNWITDRTPVFQKLINQKVNRQA